MWRMLPLLLLSSCVAVSPNLERHIDPNSDQIFYTFELGISYPKKKFMTPEEWEEYNSVPDSQKDALYEEYKNREEVEKDWDNFIDNCLLALTLDC